MLTSYKQPDVYEVRGMIRRAGMKTGTARIHFEGRKAMAAYCIADMPICYDDRLVSEYKINLTKHVVDITLASENKSQKRVA